MDVQKSEKTGIAKPATSGLLALLLAGCAALNPGYSSKFKAGDRQEEFSGKGGTYLVSNEGVEHNGVATKTLEVYSLSDPEGAKVVIGEVGNPLVKMQEFGYNPAVINVAKYQELMGRVNQMKDDKRKAEAEKLVKEIGVYKTKIAELKTAGESAAAERDLYKSQVESLEATLEGMLPKKDEQPQNPPEQK